MRLNGAVNESFLVSFVVQIGSSGGNKLFHLLLVVNVIITLQGHFRLVKPSTSTSYNNLFSTHSLTSVKATEARFSMKFIDLIISL